MSISRYTVLYVIGLRFCLCLAQTSTTAYNRIPLATRRDGSISCHQRIACIPSNSSTTREANCRSDKCPRSFHWAFAHTSRALRRAIQVTSMVLDPANSYRGPFTATGTYIHDDSCKLRCMQPSPCVIKMSNIEKFAIEEDTDVKPASVKIYFEGTLAWYKIISPHPSYTSKFADMKLKAQIWLWIQHKRSHSLLRPSIYTRNPSGSLKWPTLAQLRRDLPPHFTSRTFDPIHTFHPYFIERIIQSHLSDETLAVGPEGIQPRWMECQFAKDLENTYPVYSSPYFF